jgi:predicted choloylglycine hydrolase
MVSPFEQGVLRGKVENRAIRHTLEELERAHGFFDIPREDFLKVNESSLKHVPERYVEECRGMAEGSGLTEDELMSLNFGKGVRDLFEEGCTAFAVPMGRSGDGSVLLMKNRDLGYRRIHPQVLVYSRLDGFNSFLGVVSGGSVHWYQGMNEKGLVAFNTATPSPPYEEGISISVLIRRMLEECGNVGEALSFIRSSHYNAGSNLFLGDRERVAIVEVKSGFPPHVWEIEKPDCRANHYLFHSNPEDSTREDVLRRLQTLTRYERAKQLVGGSESIRVDHLKAFSRDHANGPGSYSICRHAAFVGSPLEKLSSSSTLSSQIFRLGEELETHVALGRPCSSEFIGITFEQEIPKDLASGSIWLENLKNKP